MITTPPKSRILAGPTLAGEPEPYAAHVARLGGLPVEGARRELIPTLEASGLLGRGGAGFPAGRKWRAIADRPRGDAVVVANGAEGEPPSHKDRVLMTHRPHLVIDGAVLAAEATGASEIVIYVGEEHTAAVASMGRAIEERRAAIRQAVRIVAAPMGYVAGEASAAVHFINAADARPTTTPPRMSERGVDGRPTLVQNVETLANAALIARFGDRWYRSVGRLGSKGTALVTVTGALREQGVTEIELGTSVAEVVADLGGPTSPIQAVVLGGYFGTWAPVDRVWDMPLDPAEMRSCGLTFGCGVIGLLPAGACGIAATARIMDFMAGESAGQCGPCVHGLRAIADTTGRFARGEAGPSELGDLDRWASQVAGRGACRHPDGAVQLLVSALDVFADDFSAHARHGRCAGAGDATIEAA